MNSYSPRLLHAIITTLFAVGLYAWSEGKQGRVLNAFIFGAAVFLIMTAAVVWMMIYGHHYERVIRYIEAFIKLDAEQRSALAFHVPSTRLIARRGRVAELFETTQATREHIRLFLTDSNREFTAAERNWNTSERPRWAHREIITWLEDNNKVMPESYAGSRSWRWIGSAYQSMMIYWIGAAVPNLDADEARVFAAED